MIHIESLVKKQQAFFETGTTLSLAYRKSQLKKLHLRIQEYEADIFAALKKDLNKSPFEAYATEIGLVYEEIRFMLKNISRYAKPQKVPTPLMHFPSKSIVYKEPYGQILIIAPWNYPFQLAMVPLISAIATGNCAIVKPSEDSSATSAVLTKIMADFDTEYVAIVEGDLLVTQALLEQKFDYIFFTGSTSVGKIIMEKAARHLTPVTLELGGKSPCIVDETADIALSAKRIVWGKLLNAGQTCVAPDYILVHQSVKEKLVEHLKGYITQFYGEHPETNEEYAKIIHQRHFDRLQKMISESTQVWGGKCNPETMQIAPALILDAHWDSKVMEEEIFGPIFPIIAYDNLQEATKEIRKRPKPLALYLFTNSKENENFVITRVSYGGGCINDTIVHLATQFLPFGGVGESGMGMYHGKQSFDTFSHRKSILKKSNFLDIPLRYAPHKKRLALLRKFL